MTNDRFHQPIKHLLEQNGAMGVNQIQKELDVPLSTIQKYLDKQQNYFKKNSARKWVLPGDMDIQEQEQMSDNFSTVIEGQVNSLKAMSDLLISTLRASISLIEAQKTVSSPVAERVENRHPNVDKIFKFSEVMKRGVKTYMSNIPEEYRELLKNLDIVAMCTNMGMDYINSEQNADLAGVLLGKTDILSEDTLKVLERHQK